MINLETYKDFLDHFLFRLCYKRHLYIQNEHFFLNPEIEILIEMATNKDQFFFENLPFLKNLMGIESYFNLNSFQFSEDILSDEQIVGLTLKHVLTNYSYEFLDYSKYIRDKKVELEKLGQECHSVKQLIRYCYLYYHYYNFYTFSIISKLESYFSCYIKNVKNYRILIFKSSNYKERVSN